MKTTMTAALLATMCGQALGQVTVDGQIGASETGLYTRAWVQNQPTSFGDNLPQMGEAEDNSDAINVTTGLEVRIPLSNFELSDAVPTGQIRIAGWVISSSNDFMSNQVIGGLGGPGANLGDPANVSFKEPSGSNPDGVPGNQFAIVPASVVSGALTVDGTADAAYGPPIFVSNTGTGFGDASDPDSVLTGGGSEISNLYATLVDEDSDGTADALYVLVGGNLEENFNKLHLWFDVDADAGSPAGQNIVRDDNADINFDAINRQAGLEFDDGFTGDLMFIYGFGDTGGQFESFADMATTPTSGGGTGVFLGAGTPALLTSATTGLGEGVTVSVDNSNIGGVGPSGFTPTIPDPDIAIGSELDAIWTNLDIPNNRLNILLACNLQSNDNRLVVFLDGDPTDGQNTLRDDNVDIAFRALDRLGLNDGSDPDDVEPLGPGLTFDAGFNADYAILVNNNGSTTSTNNIFTNAAVLRLNGPNIVQGFNTDFGAYDGGQKSAPGNDPILFDGDNPPTGVDVEPGTGDNIFTNFAPRDAAAAFLANGALGFETPGLLIVGLDNSNTGGVTDVAGNDVSDACNVTTGVEISIDLTELGWDGSSDIKIAAMITDSGSSFVSNQVAGGLPTADQLGEPREIDFSMIAGDQFVTVGDTADCPASRLCADQNGDGIVSPADFSAWVANFNTMNPQADVNQDGSVSPADFSAWVAAFNQGANGPTCNP
ncbi:MAG: GC-type dockerin domain-anchored protein [Phycisphaerales bacterium JB058]